METATVQNVNVYAPPTAHLEADHSLDYPYFSTSIKKLTILFVATFGLYTLYWFYKQWKQQAPGMDKKILPVMRSIFSIFFTHSLFNRIKKDSEEKGIESPINYMLLATAVVVLQILTGVLDELFRHQYSITIGLCGIATVLALVYPFIVIQKQINLVNDDADGTSNSKFSAYNYLFIVLGLLIWILVVADLLIPPQF